MVTERMANLGPPRHLIIADPPPDARHPELQSGGTQVMDALRKQLGGVTRYVLVNHDSVAAALQRTRSRDSVMHMLGGDMNVSIRALPMAHPDSVRWTVTLFDPTSQMRSDVVTVGPVPVNSPAASDSVAKVAARALWMLDHTPRRGVVDPIQRAFEQRAANMGPPRRVVVWDHPPDNVPGVRDGGSAVMDVLRKALATTTRYVPVSRDSTLAALDKSRERSTVLAALHADMMVSIRGRPVHGDSVSYALTVWDLGAVPQLSSRSVGGPASPISAPLLHADTLVSRAIQELQQVDRSPRQSANAAPTPGRP